MKITAILASHNRRGLTLACLASYHAQRTGPGVELSTVLVDDGSSDGTPDAVQAQFPAAEVVRGDGQLYWAAAMAWAEQLALVGDPDYLLWLNDDVVLDPDALSRLLDVSRQRADSCLVVGALRDPATGELTYSGVRRRDWHPLRMELVAPGTRPIEVETFNGNAVLVPLWIARMIGGIDGAFAHAAADLDYGLRAARIGIPILIAPGTVGTCVRKGRLPPWLDQRLPLHERLAALLGPKGIPWRSTARYLRRHGGPAWPLFWIGSYAKAAALAARNAALGQSARR